MEMACRHKPVTCRVHAYALSKVEIQPPAPASLSIRAQPTSAPTDGTPRVLRTTGARCPAPAGVLGRELSCTQGRVCHVGTPAPEHFPRLLSCSARRPVPLFMTTTQ